MKQLLGIAFLAMVLVFFANCGDKLESHNAAGNIEADEEAPNEFPPPPKPPKEEPPAATPPPTTISGLQSAIQLKFGSKCLEPGSSVSNLRTCSKSNKKQLFVMEKNGFARRFRSADNPNLCLRVFQTSQASHRTYLSSCSWQATHSFFPSGKWIRVGSRFASACLALIGSQVKTTTCSFANYHWNVTSAGTVNIPSGSTPSNPSTPSTPPPSTPTQSNSLKAMTDSRILPLVNASLSKRYLGVVVGYVKKDGKTEFYSYGKRGATDSRKIAASDMLHIASLTKTFAGSMTANIEQRGRIRIDTDAEDYLSNVNIAKRSREIRVRDLLTHRSGLPRETQDQSNFGKMARTEAELYQFMRIAQLKSVPGTSYSYSNIAFSLLGNILEKIERKSFASILSRDITNPLGMKDTYVRVPSSKQSRLVKGHYYSSNQNKFIAYPEYKPDFPARGAIKSSINDMLKYAKAHLGHTNTSLRTALQRSHRVIGTSGGTDVAYGWHTSDGGNILAHSGASVGSRAYIRLDRRKKVGVIVLANTWRRVNGSLTNEIPDAARSLFSQLQKK